MLDPASSAPDGSKPAGVVDKPDIKGREEILRIHSKGVKLAPDVDLKIVAATNRQDSPAPISRTWSRGGAARRARR